MRRRSLISCAAVGIAKNLASEFTGTNGNDAPGDQVHDGSGEPVTRMISAWLGDMLTGTG